MKKILFGTFGLLVLGLAVALVVPGVIDWNEYKGDITAKIKQATGRDVSIGGDLRISILPAPTLVANDVRLANVEGGTNPAMAELRQLEVRVAFAPLLGGTVQVERINLIDPVIHMEVLADGRRNWDFKAGASASDAAGEKDGSQASATSDEFTLDSFAVSNGTLIYRDHKSKTDERVEGIEAEVSARSLAGPFKAAGRLLYQGIPLSFRSEVGRVEGGKAIPINAGIGIEGIDMDVTLSGTLLGLSDVPRFQGKLKGAGSLTALMALGGKTGTVPGFLAQPFQLEGAVAADTKGVAIEKAVLGLGGDRAEGTVRLSLDGGEGVPSLAVEMASTKIDLDRWLSMAAVQVPAFTPRQAVRVSVSGEGRKLMNIPGAQPKGEVAAPSGFSKGVHMALGLKVGSVVLKGDIISQAQINAELANGEVTVSQISAVLPGVTNVAAFGFIVPDAAGPAFEGTVEATSSNMRGLLGWGGVNDIGVSADRLRTFRFASKARFSADEVRLSGMALDFDQSRLIGGVTVALRERLGIGANLSLNAINLDHYLASATAARPAKSGASAAGKQKPAGGTLGGGAKAYSVLDSFDANVKAKIGSLIVQGTRMEAIGFDGTLAQGGLSFRDFSIGDVAGASLKAEGGLKGLGGLPEMDNITFQIRAADPSRLFSLTGAKPPKLARTIGPAIVSGKADGSFLRPRVDASLSVAGGEAQIKGGFSFLPLTAPFSGRIALRHENMARLLSVLGSGYRPQDKLGGMDVSATLSVAADQVDVTELNGQLGPVSIEGQAGVSLAGDRPNITARFRTGIVPVKLFLPTDKAAAARSGGQARPQARTGASRTRGTVGGGTVSDRWSRDPIDFSFLKGFDATVSLDAKGVTFDTYSLSDASLHGVVRGGVLTVDRFSGNFFEGPVTGNARIDTSTATPRMAWVLRLANMDVARAVKAVSGNDLAKGRMALNLDAQTAGRSVASMVSSLDGKGNLSIVDLDVKSGGAGTVLSGVIGLFAGLGNLLPIASGGKTSSDLSSNFAINNGIATLSDLRFRSAYGNGQASGGVDLPAWLIDVKGEITVPDNLIAQILTRNMSRKPIPFTIQGDLEAPDVTLKTASLGTGVKKGLGKILDKTGIGDILGTGTTQPQTAPQTGTQTQPQTAPEPAKPQKIKPEDVFKSILKGVIRPQ